MYRVTYRKGVWAVGGAECTQPEAVEWLARGLKWCNIHAAQRIAESIKRKGERR